MTVNGKTEPKFRSSSNKSKVLEGVSVLVVDDDADARELVGIVMEQQGASVKLVESSAEALEALNEYPADIMICDINMPKGDGFSFLKELKAHSSGRDGHIPAIALTAYSLPEDRKRISRSGFQEYFTKPFEPSDLVAAVARLSGKLKTQSQ